MNTEPNPHPSRTLVVGDIQGCADELEDLLGATGFVGGRDHLVALGDLVNRGRKSLEVLRRVRGLGGETVLGNHERYLLGVLSGGTRAEDTLDSLLAAPDLGELVDWLVDREEPVIRVREWVGVHAGLPPRFNVPEDAAAVNSSVREAWRSGRTLSERAARVRANVAARFLMTVRYCDAEGRTPEDPWVVDPPGYRPWFEQRAPGPIIAFGHWATLDPARAERPDLRFLDTGCVYGRRLTGWLVEEDRVVSVPARRAYWPRGGAGRGEAGSTLRER